MMMILVIVLKFVLTNKFGWIWWPHHFEDNENIKLVISWQPKKMVEFDDIIILKTTKTLNCQYLNKLKFGCWNLVCRGSSDDADFDCGVEIWINCQNQSIWICHPFENNKTQNCQYLDNQWRMKLKFGMLG